MDNNSILRRLRFTFGFNDRRMIALFGDGNATVTREHVSDWLKRDDDDAFKPLDDEMLAIFLNGFIVHRRGRREGPQPVAEKVLNNNLILRKLKIALELRDEDMIFLLDLAGHRASKPELTAFFRKPGHRSYRECQDQILRKFLKGMQLHYHEAADDDA